MIYAEDVEKQGNTYHSFSKQNLGKKYPQWMVPVRILEITPAEFAQLLVNEFNAELHWYQNPYKPEIGFLGKGWDSYSDAIRWKDYINKRARERGFHI